jgi:hypothetical protein
MLSKGVVTRFNCLRLQDYSTPDDSQTRNDADGDGLTGVVEARLGTDPSKSDSDGDGVADPVDPCPNAPPRAMNDREKIIAAFVDAKFFEDVWNTPALIEVEGIQAFEMYGY